MNQKDIFYQDIQNCHSSFTDIMSGKKTPALQEINDLYGMADVLSLRNAHQYRRFLWLLSVAGTLLTLAFLFYDEAELHGLILACGMMILVLIVIRRISDKMDCHRKYLEYRVLAESLRVQFFLTYAGLAEKVSAILPWSVQKGIPWIAEMLDGLPEEKTPVRHPVLDCWVRTQKEYHEGALLKAEEKNRRDRRVALLVLLFTIAVYFAALVYEFFIYRNMSDQANAGVIRAVLKIILGTMSAVTLFTGNYYGKMSLDNVIEDHKRMIALYEKAEQDILRDGESRELLLFLARESLNENSTWYAYQSKNKPELIV